MIAVVETRTGTGNRPRFNTRITWRFIRTVAPVGWLRLYAVRRREENRRLISHCVDHDTIIRLHRGAAWDASLCPRAFASFVLEAVDVKDRRAKSHGTICSANTLIARHSSSIINSYPSCRVHLQTIHCIDTLQYQNIEAAMADPGEFLFNADSQKCNTLAIIRGGQTERYFLFVASLYPRMLAQA